MANNNPELLTIIKNPPKPKWEYSYTPNFHTRHQTKDAPNAFHRLAQRLILGIYWRRIK